MRYNFGSSHQGVEIPLRLQTDELMADLNEVAVKLEMIKALSATTVGDVGQKQHALTQLQSQLSSGAHANQAAILASKLAAGYQGGGLFTPTGGQIDPKTVAMVSGIKRSNADDAALGPNEWAMLSQFLTPNAQASVTAPTQRRDIARFARSFGLLQGRVASVMGVQADDALVASPQALAQTLASNPQVLMHAPVASAAKTYFGNALPRVVDSNILDPKIERDPSVKNAFAEFRGAADVYNASTQGMVQNAREFYTIVKQLDTITSQFTRSMQQVTAELKAAERALLTMKNVDNQFLLSNASGAARDAKLGTRIAGATLPSSAKANLGNIAHELSVKEETLMAEAADLTVRGMHTEAATAIRMAQNLSRGRMSVEDVLVSDAESANKVARVQKRGGRTKTDQMLAEKTDEYRRALGIAKIAAQGEGGYDFTAAEQNLRTAADALSQARASARSGYGNARTGADKRAALGATIRGSLGVLGDDWEMEGSGFHQTITNLQRQARGTANRAAGQAGGGGRSIADEQRQQLQMVASRVASGLKTSPLYQSPLTVQKTQSDLILMQRLLAPFTGSNVSEADKQFIAQKIFPILGLLDPNNPNAQLPAGTAGLSGWFGAVNNATDLNHAATGVRYQLQSSIAGRNSQMGRAGGFFYNSFLPMVGKADALYNRLTGQEEGGGRLVSGLVEGALGPMLGLRPVGDKGVYASRAGSNRYGRAYDSVLNTLNKRTTNLSQMMGVSLYGMGVLGAGTAITAGTMGLYSEAESQKTLLAGMVNNYSDFITPSGEKLEGPSKFRASLDEADMLYQAIRKEARESILTTRELMDYYVAGSPHLLGKGLTQDQTLSTIDRIATLGSALGLPQAATISDIRDLAMGRSNSRSQILQAVGIRDSAELKSAIDKGGPEFFKYIEGKLSGFEPSFEALKTNPQAVFNKALDDLQQIGIKFGATVFTSFKPGLEALMESMNDFSNNGAAAQFARMLGTVAGYVMKIGSAVGGVLGTAGASMGSSDYPILGPGAPIMAGITAISAFHTGGQLIGENRTRAAAVGTFRNEIGGHAAYIKSTFGHFASDLEVQQIADAYRGKPGQSYPARMAAGAVETDRLLTRLDVTEETRTNIRNSRNSLANAASQVDMATESVKTSLAGLAATFGLLIAEISITGEIARQEQIKWRQANAAGEHGQFWGTDRQSKIIRQQFYANISEQDPAERVKTLNQMMADMDVVKKYNAITSPSELGTMAALSGHTRYDAMWKKVSQSYKGFEKLDKEEQQKLVDAAMYSAASDPVSRVWLGLRGANPILGGAMDAVSQLGAQFNLPGISAFTGALAPAGYGQETAESLQKQNDAAARRLRELGGLTLADDIGMIFKKLAPNLRAKEGQAVKRMVEEQYPGVDIDALIEQFVRSADGDTLFRSLKDDQKEALALSLDVLAREGAKVKSQLETNSKIYAIDDKITANKRLEFAAQSILTDRMKYDPESVAGYLPTIKDIRLRGADLERKQALIAASEQKDPDARDAAMKKAQQDYLLTLQQINREHEIQLRQARELNFAREQELTSLKEKLATDRLLNAGSALGAQSQLRSVLSGTPDFFSGATQSLFGAAAGMVRARGAQQRYSNTVGYLSDSYREAVKQAAVDVSGAFAIPGTLDDSNKILDGINSMYGLPLYAQTIDPLDPMAGAGMGLQFLQSSASGQPSGWKYDPKTGKFTSEFWNEKLGPPSMPKKKPKDAAAKGAASKPPAGSKPGTLQGTFGPPTMSGPMGAAGQLFTTGTLQGATLSPDGQLNQRLSQYAEAVGAQGGVSTAITQAQTQYFTALGQSIDFQFSRDFGGMDAQSYASQRLAYAGMAPGDASMQEFMQTRNYGIQKQIEEAKRASIKKIAPQLSRAIELQVMRLAQDTTDQADAEAEIERLQMVAKERPLTASEQTELKAAQKKQMYAIRGRQQTEFNANMLRAEAERVTSKDYQDTIKSIIAKHAPLSAAIGSAERGFSDRLSMAAALAMPEGTYGAAGIRLSNTRELAILSSQQEQQRKTIQDEYLGALKTAGSPERVKELDAKRIADLAKLTSEYADAQERLNAVAADREEADRRLVDAAERVASRLNSLADTALARAQEGLMNFGGPMMNRQAVIQQGLSDSIGAMRYESETAQIQAVQTLDAQLLEKFKLSAAFEGVSEEQLPAVARRRLEEYRTTPEYAAEVSGIRSRYQASLRSSTLRKVSESIPGLAKARKSDLFQSVAAAGLLGAFGTVASGGRVDFAGGFNALASPLAEAQSQGLSNALNLGLSSLFGGVSSSQLQSMGYQAVPVPGMSQSLYRDPVTGKLLSAKGAQASALRSSMYNLGAQVVGGFIGNSIAGQGNEQFVSTGMALGGAVGGQVFAKLGSMAGPAGTVAGALVGALVGSIFGRKRQAEQEDPRLLEHRRNVEKWLQQISANTDPRQDLFRVFNRDVLFGLSSSYISGRRDVVGQSASLGYRGV